MTGDSMDNMKSFFKGAAGRVLLIGSGGFLGAIARYLIKNFNIPDLHGGIPLDTLVINIIGSFLLTFIITYAINRKMGDNLRFGLTTGFLGAFTTFSSICREVYFLFSKGEIVAALSYIILTSVLGLTAAWLGTFTAQRAFTHIDDNREVK
jgi:CrcB protein